MTVREKSREGNEQLMPCVHGGGSVKSMHGWQWNWVTGV